MSLVVCRQIIGISSKPAAENFVRVILGRCHSGFSRGLSFPSNATTTKQTHVALCNRLLPRISSYVIQDRKFADQVDHDVGGNHHPSDLEKKILVWTKHYKSLDEIPETISQSKMKRAKDVFRIRVNIMMAVSTVFVCAVMIILGRRASKQGESLHKQNLAWHKELGTKE